MPFRFTLKKKNYFFLYFSKVIQRKNKKNQRKK